MVYGGDLVLKVTKKILWFTITVTELHFDICEIVERGCPVEGYEHVRFSIPVSPLAPNVSN